MQRINSLVTPTGQNRNLRNTRAMKLSDSFLKLSPDAFMTQKATSKKFFQNNDDEKDDDEEVFFEQV